MMNKSANLIIDSNAHPNNNILHDCGTSTHLEFIIQQQGYPNIINCKLVKNLY